MRIIILASQLDLSIYLSIYLSTYSYDGGESNVLVVVKFDGRKKIRKSQNRFRRLEVNGLVGGTIKRSRRLSGALK